MKIVAINAVTYGSPAGIMYGIKKVAEEEGHTTYTASSFVKKPQYNEKSHIISGIFQKSLHILLGRITGYHGCFSHLGTYLFLKKLDKIKPDIIHLHNLHGWYINLPMLFKYIKKNKIKTIWTLHDCWSFTGHCTNFTVSKCNKWKDGCYLCPQYKSYPNSFVDRSYELYKLKKKWFTGVENMTIVTPSEWLRDLVKQSFLKEYPVKVINNGINLGIFKPTESDFKKKYNLDDKIILMGCAFPWSRRKGLDVFSELSKRLDERFKIVLVGLSKEQKENLPDNIISIQRTQSREELAKIYTAADIFVNPTREDNFPTVNIEALACGTPVITFKTGGSPEILDECSGRVVECDDVDALINEIYKMADKPLRKEDCIKRAGNFDMNDKFRKYVDLYNDCACERD